MIWMWDVKEEEIQDYLWVCDMENLVDGGTFNEIGKTVNNLDGQGTDNFGFGHKNLK